MKKSLLIMSYILLFFVLIFNKDALLIWIKQGQLSIGWMLTLLVFFGLFPVIPYGVLGALAGAKFGLLNGSILNIVGSTLSALIMFQSIRMNFSIIPPPKHKKLKHIRSLMEENAFLTIFFGRIIPVIPAQLVNIVASVTNVKLATFIIATIIGKIPVMFVFAFVGNELIGETNKTVQMLVIYLFFLAAVLMIYKVWSKRKTSS